MNKFLLALIAFLSLSIAKSQTTWQVCVEDPPSTTCAGKTGTFTPGNLVIQQGDMIQFTTTMVLLIGYTGTDHNIEFAGSPANNVNLLVSSDILNQVTTVTTPPFNTPGVFPMECANFNHCILAEYACTGYSVTVQSTCSVTASFTTPNMTVCTGDIVNFTNTSTGATTYDWHLDEFTFSTTTNSVLSFGAAGSYDIELISDDGAGCLDSTTITINVDPESDAGSDNSQIFCNLNDSIDLNSLVNGDTGGIWEETTSSGQFNATSGVLDYSALAQSIYLFDYIIPGVGVCPNDTAEMTVNVNQEPDLTLNLTGTTLDISDSLLVDFTTAGVLGGATYLWSFCDGNLQTDSSPFYYTWTTQGNYCVCVEVNNGNGCIESFCDSSVVVFDASAIEDLSTTNIRVYPNPTAGIFTIDLTQIQNDVTLEIYDQANRLVFEKQTSGGTNLVLNSTEFEAGNYFIHVITAGQKKVLSVIFQ